MGYYIAFDGIGDRLAMYDFSEAEYGALPGTYIVGLQPPQGSGRSLDREQGLVQIGGFNAEVRSTDDVNTFFARRGGVETSIRDGLDKAHTVITLASGSATYADGATIHVDAEAITLGANTSGGEYTGCTRGALGSIATAHAAEARVSDRPLVWLGRRAELVAVNIFLLETGDTVTSETISTGLLSSSPKFVNGAWEISFADMSRALNGSVYTGWSPVVVTGADITYGGDSVEIAVPDAKQFSDEADGFIRIRIGDSLEIYRLQSANVDHGANTITVVYDDITYADAVSGERLRSRNTIQSTEDPPDVEIQQVHVINDTPGRAALKLMLSDLGDGAASATYDVLPGVERGTSAASQIELTGRRIGAAIPASWVDVAAWEEIDESGGARRSVFIIDEPMTVVDFLWREVTWRAGARIETTPAGLITVKRYLPAIPDASIKSLGVSDLADKNVSVVDDEADIPNRAEFSCNWNVRTREYEQIVSVDFNDVAQRYDYERPIELASRSLRVGRSTSAVYGAIEGVDEIVGKLDRIHSRYADGVRKIRLIFPWRFHVVMAPGYIFKFTDPRAPDGEGGYGISGRQFEVTSTDLNTQQGPVAVEAEEQQQGWIVAPSATVASVGPGNQITLTSSEDYHEGSPAHLFMTGATVALRDATSSPKFNSGEAQTVASIDSATQLTLDALPGTFTLAAGDLIELENSANTGNVATTTNADVQDHGFLADDTGEPKIDPGGGTERDGIKWR
ncbi:MAG: hypothetical protein ACPG6R_11035 [Aequoribacter sp.]|uniref:hypothetical protein n=1 Tax=Aequoribacter sp. TaxID=2847771 RepID=UPI003C478C67